MHVWNELHAARWKYRTQKWHKNSPSAHHCTTLSGYNFATKACIDNRKKNLLNSNISRTCPYNMVNFGPLAPEIVSLVWGTPANFNAFASWQRYCTVLQQWASAKLCGVEQRAPPIFGRAAITLGIGPHSRFIIVFPYSKWAKFRVAQKLGHCCCYSTGTNILKDNDLKFEVIPMIMTSLQIYC